ncbi:MAG: hypothetical protein GF308_20110 [Candidatus Heimdallarchaeota archaeon]|nr:hypothetical protein [Candidatus Heimdallarchaeota archaeon]
MRKASKIVIAISTILLVFLASFGTVHAIGIVKVKNPTKEIGNFRLGLSYPPLKNDRHRKITQYHCEKLEIDLLRMGISWSYIEPNKGTYKWSGFDKRMNFCRENGLDILLTISSDGPKWNNDLETPISSTYKNVTIFKLFLQELFNRYKEHNIHKIQFGNEWPNSYQFIGTAEQFVNYSNTVYTIAKEIIPTTTFVLGGIATTNLRLAAAYYNYTDSFRLGSDRKIYSGEELQTYLNSEEVQKGVERVKQVLANASFDELDLHLYDDYQFWDTYVTMMKDFVPGKSIIVSEFGGPNILWEKYSNKKQAQHLNNSLAILNGLDIEEAYYFKLVQSKSSTLQHRKSSLLNSLLTIKPAYYIMQTFTKGAYKWDFSYNLIYSLIPAAIIGIIILIINLGLFINKYVKKRKKEEKNLNISDI